MTEVHNTQFEDYAYSPNYAQELRDVFVAKYPDLAANDTFMEITRLGMHSIKARHSDPLSPDFKDYHNDRHVKDVIKYGLPNNDITHYEFTLEPTTRSRLIIGYAGLFHDFIVGRQSQTGTISIPFGDMQIVIESDGKKTDEEMSAECARQVLSHYGVEESIAADVESAIMASEVVHQGMHVLPTERAMEHQSITDQIMRVTDTYRIIAQGMNAGLEDISNLAAEVSRLKGIPLSDVTHIMEEFMKILSAQKAFVYDRFKIYKAAAAMLPFDEERIQLATESVERKFHGRIERALGYAAFIEDNLSKIQEKVQASLEEGVTQAGDRSKVIYDALSKAVQSLQQP